MIQQAYRRRLKTVADRVGIGILVVLLVASAVSGPAWMVLAFILVVPVAAVVWAVAWRRWLDAE